MPYTGIERVDNTVGQANSSDFLIRPTIVMHYATEVCETFGDLDILTHAWTDWTVSSRKPLCFQHHWHCLGLQCCGLAQNEYMAFNVDMLFHQLSNGGVILKLYWASWHLLSWHWIFSSTNMLIKSVMNILQFLEVVCDCAAITVRWEGTKLCQHQVDTYFP